jgi:predicted transposase/invertase (TIGR01784 family)
MKTDRKFKNNVFTMLFHDPDLLRELYCALEGISLPPDTPVSINTLENVLFLDFNNDISFEIDGKLVILIEHQSTINPNMALRFLFYISRVLEKIIDSRTLYSRRPVKIPRPEFFVLYNGKDPFPDTAVYKLSELFKKSLAHGLPEKKYPLLELEVKVININEGRNDAIQNRCQKLTDYSKFITRIHSFWKECGNLEEAVEKAIKYCSKHGILREYLEKHGSEVLNMILTEWNTEDAIAFAREEGREEGRDEGLIKGLEQGKKKEKLEIAMNLLAEGVTQEFAQKITGLDLEIIQELVMHPQ